MGHAGEKDGVSYGEKSCEGSCEGGGVRGHCWVMSTSASHAMLAARPVSMALAALAIGSALACIHGDRSKGSGSRADAWFSRAVQKWVT